MPASSHCMRVTRVSVLGKHPAWAEDSTSTRTVGLSLGPAASQQWRKSDETKGREMLYKLNYRSGQHCRSSMITLKQLGFGLTCSWGPGSGQEGEGHPSGDTGRTKLVPRCIEALTTLCQAHRFPLSVRSRSVAGARILKDQGC